MSHHITLMTRVDCHLCDDARGVVTQVAAETGTPVEERDVDTDPALRAEYGDWVPVVLIDGKQHGFFRIDEQRLRRALA
jgi:glutaredoxin